AVDQPAVPDHDGREYPGQGIGRAHRLDHAAMGEPDLVTGPHFGCYACEFLRQILDRDLSDRGFELRREFVAADQPGPIETNIEVAQDAARLQAARPL